MSLALTYTVGFPKIMKGGFHIYTSEGVMSCKYLIISLFQVYNCTKNSSIAKVSPEMNTEPIIY